MTPTPGQLVRYYSKNGWHTGRLKSVPLFEIVPCGKKNAVRVRWEDVQFDSGLDCSAPNQNLNGSRTHKAL